MGYRGALPIRCGGYPPQLTATRYRELGGTASAQSLENIFYIENWVASGS